MQPEEIRTAVDLLMDRVALTRSDDDACEVAFADLDHGAMVALGITPEIAGRLVAAPWWAEMIDDVAETPDFCEPDDTPDQVLQYARDVVKEYVAKRL